MKRMKPGVPRFAALLCAAVLAGCASQGGSAEAGFGWWGSDGGWWDGRSGHSRGGRSEPGNEAGMYPARPTFDGRGGSQGGGSRGGEAGMQ